MASNPIQRRSRQSFLVGFLLALIIMAVVVVFLFMRINSLNEEIEELELSEVTVYTTTSDIKSGEVISGNNLVATTIRSELDTSGYITSSYLYQTDEDGNEIEFVAKIDIAAGTFVTESMVSASSDVTSDDDRIIEYNMIVLPSQLTEGDYIDIRLALPSGAEYIVLSKKYVEQTTSTAVWMNMSEVEILTLNSAIVESYMITGSRLYAVTYSEPGLQDAATTTYAVNNEVLTAINADPNILEEARTELASRWSSDSTNDGTTDYATERSEINSYLSDMEDDEKASAVESGYSTEDTAISEAREEYISNLEAAY